MNLRGKLYISIKSDYSLTCAHPMVTSGSLDWPYSIWESEKIPKKIVMGNACYLLMITFLSFSLCKILGCHQHMGVLENIQLTNLKGQKWKQLSHPSQMRESNLDLDHSQFFDSTEMLFSLFPLLSKYLQLDKTLAFKVKNPQYV